MLVSRSSSNIRLDYINFLKQFEGSYTRGTRTEQHARNPRETQMRGTRAKRRRTEPARTINTSSIRSSSSNSSSSSR